MATKRWKRDFKFLPQKYFYSPLKSNNFFSNIFLTLRSRKNFMGKNSKIRSQRFVANLVVRKTVGGDRFSVKQELQKRETKISLLKFFRKNLKMAVNPKLRVKMT